MSAYNPELEYLGIDPEYADDVVIRNVNRAESVARATIRGTLGDDAYVYLGCDPRLRELELIYMDDLYSNRGVSAKVSNATRQLVQTMELQLQMELRRFREAAKKEAGT